MIHTLVFTGVLLLSGLPSARADEAFFATYMDERGAFQAAVDSCDLINARDVLSLSTQPLLELEGDLPHIRHLFDVTDSARRSCYTAARKSLDNLLEKGSVYLTTHEDETLFARQLELDTALREALGLRIKISHQLLRSTLNDIETAISTYISSGAKKKKKEVFYDESPLTRGLIKQDMDMILEIERRQLNLDEVRLVSGTPDVTKLAQVKLSKAHHYMSRALMAFEDMHLQPRMYPLARLNTEFAYANNQFAELFAFSPKLDGLDRALAREIARTADKATVMALDVDGALRDMRTGLFKENYDNWLSELYQDMSTLTLDLQTARAKLNPHVLPPDTGPSLTELEAAFDDVKAKSTAPDAINPDEMPARMIDGKARLKRLMTAKKEGK
ncbi:MAG: hypothetical protein GC134_02575 [Proteobacteria bacterium]|nr:hypothetical protein [Pseudomonadota bacterium]